MKKSISSLLIIPLFCLYVANIKAQTQSQDSASTYDNLSHQVFQVSFIPYFGTNGHQSPNVINNISFNILAGYNGGTTGFELGGLVNIDRYDVNATQIAGIGNHAGRSTKGVQIAGIYNLSKAMTGTQIAGITNIVSDMNGVQIAGLSNHTITGNSVQIGGLINLTEDRAVFQLAGLTNHARNCKGVQIAGLINTTKESTGSQIAGILNVASSFKGVQIGLINIADSSNGVPIGLINIIKNGYQRFEISADEFFQANVAYRSGIEKFHAIITAGIQPRSIDSPLWSYGVGVGTSEALSSKTLLDFDASFHHVVKKAEVGDNHLYKVYLGIDRSLSSHVSLAFGLTYNFLATDIRSNVHREYYSDIAPYYFSNQNINHSNLKTWAGFKVGLRFR